MERTYKDLIFTNHALNRMRKRTITQASVWQTLQHPDRTIPEEKPDTSRFIRTINQRTYHVIATFLPEQNKTLIVSTWVRGEEDPVPLSWKVLRLPFRLGWKLLVWTYKRIKPN